MHDWEQVRAIAIELHDLHWANRALGQIGIAAFYNNDQETAGKNVGTALEVATKQEDKAAQIRFTTALGMGFTEAKMFERSLPYFDQALEIANTMPQAGYPFLVQEGRIEALIGLKQYDAAQTIADEFLKNAAVKARRGLLAESLYYQATISLGRGNVTKANTDLNRALEICKIDGFQHLRAQAEALLTKIYLTNNDLRAAEYHASEAATATQASGYRWAVPETLRLLANIQVRHRRYLEANRTFDRAQAFMDSALASASTVLQKTSLIKSSTQISSEHFDLVASKLNDSGEAYGVVEQVRGRVNTDLLLAGSINSPEAERTESSISLLQLELMDARSTEDLNRIRHEMFTLEQVRWVVPGISILKRKVQETVPPDLVQQSLDDSTLIVEYVVTETKAYCLALSHASLQVIQLGAASGLNYQVSLYLKTVKAKLPARTESSVLYDALLRPIPGIASHARIVIIPDGGLHFLPFDALEKTSGEYLGDSHVVTYAPSVTTFYLLSQQHSSVPSRWLATVPGLALVSRARNTFTKSLDFPENQISIGSPGEGLGMLVTLVQIVKHGFFQNTNGGVTTSPNTALGHFREESLHQI